MKLKGVNILVNYPDEEQVAALPSEMTIEQLASALRLLCQTEPDATSFMITAVINRKVETGH